MRQFTRCGCCIPIIGSKLCNRAESGPHTFALHEPANLGPPGCATDVLGRQLRPGGRRGPVAFSETLPALCARRCGKHRRGLTLHHKARCDRSLYWLTSQKDQQRRSTRQCDEADSRRHISRRESHSLRVWSPIRNRNALFGGCFSKRPGHLEQPGANRLLRGMAPARPDSGRSSLRWGSPPACSPWPCVCAAVESARTAEQGTCSGRCLRGSSGVLALAA